MPTMIHSLEELSKYIRRRRKAIGLSQADLAGASGLGVGFVSDMERAKPTCEIGKAIRLLLMLGIDINLISRAETEE